MKWYFKALEINEKHFRAMLGVANDYYYMEEYAKAVEWYFKCLEVGGDNGQVF